METKALVLEERVFNKMVFLLPIKLLNVDFYMEQ